MSKPLSRRAFVRGACASGLAAVVAVALGKRGPSQTAAVEQAKPAPVQAPVSTPEDWQPPVDNSLQQAARSERTHSPCYKSAMEERALAESLATDDLEDRLPGASPDEISALIDGYQRKVADIAARFQADIATCA